ncbi:hypothetical protein HG530_012921 [Fusarium avenaceum]|nr:hypothetical protein HG530_012921 [Fusarium avenaceum]
MDSSRESELRGARLRDAGLVRSEDDSREEGLAMCLPAAEGVDCKCFFAELYHLDHADMNWKHWSPMF